MIPDLPTMTIPLRTDRLGAIRIGQTNILLELVIRAYQQGETPESIVDGYPTLQPADVYSVIGYYLANRKEVDAYVREREALTDTVITELEAQRTSDGDELRMRLRAYRDQHNGRE